MRHYYWGLRSSLFGIVPAKCTPPPSGGVVLGGGRERKGNVRTASQALHIAVGSILAAVPAWQIQKLHGVGVSEPISVRTPGELTGVIVQLTEQLTAGSTFSQDSIVINVLSPDVPDLTIIDLPGIVRTATSGQDRNVIRAVDELLDIYLESERTIILAVIPANQDIATVDILERAAEVDPKSDRTIGVLTKPDMVSPGSEDAVFETVSNRLKPLKLGYVIMKNRSQTEVAEGTSLDEAKTAERRYFESHDVYSKLPSTLYGGPALTSRLADLLVKRIKTVLPVMKVPHKTGVVPPPSPPPLP